MAGEIQHAVNDIIFTMTGCHGNMYSVAKEILRIQGIDIGRQDCLFRRLPKKTYRR